MLALTFLSLFSGNILGGVSDKEGGYRPYLRLVSLCPMVFGGFKKVDFMLLEVGTVEKALSLRGY